MMIVDKNTKLINRYETKLRKDQLYKPYTKNGFELKRNVAFTKTQLFIFYNPSCSEKSW